MEKPGPKKPGSPGPYQAINKASPYPARSFFWDRIAPQGIWGHDSIVKSFVGQAAMDRPPRGSGSNPPAGIGLGGAADGQTIPGEFVKRGAGGRGCPDTLGGHRLTETWHWYVHDSSLAQKFGLPARSRIRSAGGNNPGDSRGQPGLR